MFGLSLLTTRDRLRLAIVIFLSFASALIDILLARTLANTFSSCSASIDSCKSHFGTPVEIFVARILLSIVVVIVTAAALQLMTNRLLRVSTLRILEDKSNEVQEATGAGLHNLTHDIPHFIHLYYNSLATLGIEMFIAVPLLVYFLLKANLFLVLTVSIVIATAVVVVRGSRRSLNSRSSYIQRFSETLSEDVQLALKQAKEYYATNLTNNQLNSFAPSYKTYSKAIAFMFAYITAQKPLVELILVTSVVLSLALVGKNNVHFTVESLTALLILVYRLLPSTGRILSAIGNLRHSEDSVIRLERLLQAGMRNEQEREHSQYFSNLMFDESFRTTLDAASTWNINLESGKGIIWVRGPSGVGKTMLLESFFSARPRSPLKAEFQPLLGRGHQLAYVPQFPENTWRSYGSYIQNFLVDFKCVSGSLLALRLKNDSFSDKIYSQMSGGEKYKIAVTRALCSGASIILLDEPFASLDPESAKVLMEKLSEASRSALVFVISHQNPMQFSTGNNIRVLEIEK